MDIGSQYDDLACACWCAHLAIVPAIPGYLVCADQLSEEPKIHQALESVKKV
jgi:hypothetical protein